MKKRTSRPPADHRPKAWTKEDGVVIEGQGPNMTPPEVARELRTTVATLGFWRYLSRKRKVLCGPPWWIPANGGSVLYNRQEFESWKATRGGMAVLPKHAGAPLRSQKTAKKRSQAA